MSLRVGINGFGRIGRRVFRLALKDPEIQVTQINDLSPAATLAHLIKYDSVHGTLEADVRHEGSFLIVDGRKIYCSASRDPHDLDWSQGKVDIVLECTGKFKDHDSAELHRKSGPKKVIVSAPGKDNDLTIVFGVNQQDYNPSQHHIISNASCTTNCLAPVVKVLDDAYKIQHGFMTTVHSFTNDQRILCGAHKDLRRARAASLGQIPTSTGAAKAIGLVLPHLKGKLEGMAIRVPTPNVSLIDFVAQVEKKATVESVHQNFEQAIQKDLKGILDISYEPLVSNDYNGSRFSAVVDALSTSVLGENLVKVLAWYDNETGFSQRMIDLAKFIGKNLG